jgi:hypothetical protein
LILLTPKFSSCFTLKENLRGKVSYGNTQKSVTVRHR